jgi:hypothetical protein
MLEIDGVQRALEWPRMEAGDYISDNYWDLIDITTSEDSGSHMNGLHIASLVRKLNRNHGFIAVWVGKEPEIAEAYNSVVNQLNDLNAGVEGADPLMPISAEQSENQIWYGAYQWAN